VVNAGFGSKVVESGNGLIVWAARPALADPAQDLALARHLGPAFAGIMAEAWARANGPYSEKSGAGRIGTGNCAG
jgi:hypothetical protein